MKLKQTLFIITITMLIFSSTNRVSAVDHNEEHAHEGALIHTTPDQCGNPTATLLIVAGGSGQLIFDKAEYNVEKDTCIEITYQNIEPNLDHDLNIDVVEGANGIAQTHAHMANNTDGPTLDGTVTLKIKTPNADTEFLIYCSVPGHENMKSTLIVGEGNPDDKDSPAFELFGAIFSLSIVVFILKQRKK